MNPFSIEFIIALLLGFVFGVMFGAVWRSEEMEAIQKANARLIEERDHARNQFRNYAHKRVS